MKIKTKIYIIVLSVITIILLPIIAFIYNFKNHFISDKISDWGATGDFFGGFLNSFFSLLTLIITIYIAYELTGIEERRNNENLKFEKEKLLREFRELEYKKINEELQKVWLCLTESNNEIAMSIIHGCIWKYRYFVTSNNHLYPFLRDTEISELRNSLIEISKILEKKPAQGIIDETVQKFMKDLDNFNSKFQIFLLKS